MSEAIAYVLRGDWVAACPRPECSNVEFLDHVKHRQSKCTSDTYYCTYCHMVASITWPPNKDELWEPLSRRPVPHTRNWYPKDHPEAIRYRIEHGQSPSDLWRENEEHGV